MKRKKEQDKKNGVFVQERELNIPTQDELEEYILNKTRELRMQQVVRTPQELMTEHLDKELRQWRDEEHIKLLNNEQVK
jgi:hypothetical protein